MNEYICTSKTEEYVNRIEAIIRYTKQGILDFFEAEDHGEFTYRVYVYENQHELLSGLKRRGVRKAPKNAVSYFNPADQSLNFFKPDGDDADAKWTLEEYDLVIYHELIHAIQYSIYGPQPEWVSEGIAKSLDGTYKAALRFAVKDYARKNEFPDFEKLQVDVKDCNSDDFAYMLVTYLLETLGKKRFLDFLTDASEVDDMLKIILERMLKDYTLYFS